MKLTSSLFAVKTHISAPEYYLNSFLAKNSNPRAEYVMHWAWKTQPLINLFCSNFSPPWSTFQTQAFLEKRVHTRSRSQKGATSEHGKHQLPKFQLPLWSPWLVMLIWVPSSILEKKEKYQSNGVFLCDAKKQHIFPAFSFLNSFLVYEFMQKHLSSIYCDDKWLPI